MRLLLDTHALLWWLDGDPQLGPGARARIAVPSTVVLVSMASLWELAIKISLGKLQADFHETVQSLAARSIDILQVEPAHLSVLLKLDHHHRDPFDRLLIAQAIAERATLMSEDERFPLYPVPLVSCR